MTKPQYLEFGGQQMVVISKAEFELLTRRAENNYPPLPEPNEDGVYPFETLAIVMAQDIVKARSDLGLSRAELAKLAGVRPKTLHRIEQGQNAPNVRTIEKIDLALKKAERKNRKPKSD